jgi:two-component sensor histidine kinase
MLREDVREVSIEEYAEGLIEALALVLDPNGTVTIETRITDFLVDPKKAFSLGIIVNELLTNSFKHAFGGRKNGRVSISIDREDDTVVVIVQDNGVGLDESYAGSDSPGFGLTVVKMLVEQSGGTYDLVTDNGARNVVRFRVE